MGRVEGKVAIVSGGGRGIGYAHVQALAGEGARVVSFDIKPGDGPSLVRRLGEDRALFLEGDVTSSDDWSRIVLACEERFGEPTVLINNAGICSPHRLEDVTEATYRRILDINLVGTFLGMQAVIPAMRRAGGGSIINTSSAAGMVGFANINAYVASKWAIRGMTKAAARELAPDRIRVNVLCPHDTDTPGNRETAEAGGGAVPDLDKFPFGRWATVEEVSAAMLFLASDESSYVSGSDLVVDAAFTVC